MVVASQFTLWPDAQGEPMVSPHLKSLRPFLRRGDFAPGSAGQNHVPEIAPWVDVSVCKVAYSAFFNTQLDWVLRRAGITTVAVCGIVTNGGVASTVRDAHMRELDREYPGYGFAQHKGYPVKAHTAALGRLGACKIHRTTFGPVRVALGLPPLHAPLQR